MYERIGRLAEAAGTVRKLGLVRKPAPSDLPANVFGMFFAAVRGSKRSRCHQ
jgi:hypothetical protein